FSVDALTATFKSMLTSTLAPGDIGYVESTRDRSWLLGTARLPRDTSSRIERTMPLRYSVALLHLSTDAAALYASNRTMISSSVILGGLVWLFAGIVGVGIVLYRRSREATIALEGERARLENEMVIARHVEAGLRKAAYSDALTGLPNRAAFWERASEAIAQTGNSTRYAVFFIDLDRFNVINDTRGHLAGDELLIIIATRLRDVLPAHASISRVGGDEFVVLLETGSSVAAVADRILAALREPMMLDGQAVYSGASIGVVLVDPGYGRPEDLLRDADIAMYSAKRNGRGRYAIFDAAMGRQVVVESEMDRDLRHAIERNEFVPYYQPIVDIDTRSVVSFEALARWNKPGRGVVGAVEFIEYAERHGLVPQIDALVFAGVCRDAATLFDRFPDATVAVNISAVDLTSPGLAASILAVLRDHHLPVERIKFEITETAAMIDTAQAHKTLDELRSNGFQIILDDFGSGHSSLAYLHQLPIAGVKIDRSFTSALATDPQAVAIVRSIVALAVTLGYRTVAEGVETNEQLEILRQLGVCHAQGFLFSPPLELAALPGTFLATDRALGQASA
ncbi:MAG: EAL domain-containing protein, partial [Candidatus Baltobacteraceae bacterium]